MIKQILSIFGIVLVLSLLLSGCLQKETGDQDIKDIEEGSSELDDLEQELDTSDIEDFEKGLDDIEGW